MPALGYAIELGVFNLFTYVFFVLVGGILLTYRFTPAKRVPKAKQGMLLLCLLSLFLNVPRGVDLQSVYGLIPWDASCYLHSIVTAIHLTALNLYIHSTARALYQQMQRPMPQAYALTLFGVNVFYALAITVCLPIKVYTSHHNRERLSLLGTVEGIAFDITVLWIIVVNTVLYVRLGGRLRAFIQTMETQQRNIEEAKQKDRVKQGEKTEKDKVLRVHFAPSTPAEPEPPPSASSSPSSRVSELRSALRRLTILCCLVIAIGSGCITDDLSGGTLSVLGGGLEREETLFGPDPDAYNIILFLMPMVQHINILIVCWYCWPQQFLFLKKHREARGLHFWDGLLSGVGETGGSRTCAAYETSSLPSTTAKRQQQLQSSTKSVAPMSPPDALSPSLGNSRVLPLSRRPSFFITSPLSPSSKQAWGQIEEPPPVASAVLVHSDTPTPLATTSMRHTENDGSCA